MLCCCLESWYRGQLGQPLSFKAGHWEELPGNFTDSQKSRLLYAGWDARFGHSPAFGRPYFFTPQPAVQEHQKIRMDFRCRIFLIRPSHMEFWYAECKSAFGDLFRRVHYSMWQIQWAITGVFNHKCHKGCWGPEASKQNPSRINCVMFRVIHRWSSMNNNT